MVGLSAAVLKGWQLGSIFAETFSLKEGKKKKLHTVRRLSGFANVPNTSFMLFFYTQLNPSPSHLTTPLVFASPPSLVSYSAAEPCGESRRSGELRHLTAPAPQATAKLAGPPPLFKQI